MSQIFECKLPVSQCYYDMFVKGGQQEASIFTGKKLEFPERFRATKIGIANNFRYDASTRTLYAECVIKTGFTKYFMELEYSRPGFIDQFYIWCYSNWKTYND